MYNKKALSDAISKLNAAKAPKQEPDRVVNFDTKPFVSNQGYKQGPPPSNTHYRIPGDTIYNPTPYHLKAISSNGLEAFIPAYDTTNYTFSGADYVDEIHMAKRGGAKRLPKGKTKSLSGVNKLMIKNPLFRSYGHRLFDPSHHSFQPGGEKFVDSEPKNDFVYINRQVEVSPNNYTTQQVAVPKNNTNLYKPVPLNTENLISYLELKEKYPDIHEKVKSDWQKNPDRMPFEEYAKDAGWEQLTTTENIKQPYKGNKKWEELVESCPECLLIKGQHFERDDQGNIYLVQNPVKFPLDFWEKMYDQNYNIEDFINIDTGVKEEDSVLKEVVSTPQEYKSLHYHQEWNPFTKRYEAMSPKQHMMLDREAYKLQNKGVQPTPDNMPVFQNRELLDASSRKPIGTRSWNTGSGWSWQEGDIIGNNSEKLPNTSGKRLMNKKRKKLITQPDNENNFVETDLTEEEIEQYKKEGFIIEELPQAQEGSMVQRLLQRAKEQSEKPGFKTQQFAKEQLAPNVPKTMAEAQPIADQQMKQQRQVDAKQRKATLDKAAENYMEYYNKTYGSDYGMLNREQAFKKVSQPGFDVDKYAGMYNLGEDKNAQFTSNNQSTASRIWDVVTNPLTAFKYSVQTGDFRNMPSNLNAARMAGHDVDPDNLVGNALNMTTNLFDAGDKVVRNVGEGNYGTAALEAMRFLPGARVNTGAGEYLTTQTPLRNAYKYNPWAFKANPEAYYRVLGKEGVNDAFESGIIRANPKNIHPFSGEPIYDRPYFSKGTPFDRDWKSPFINKKGKQSVGSIYPDETMVEVFGHDKFHKTGDLVTSPIDVLNSSDEGINFYKRDWLRGYKPINTPKQLPGSSNTFKSEIDWAKWNPDTPKYPELINEYNAIEETTKADGTWMKNPDGSAFQGTPEQFIQQQSSHFKKAFGDNYVKGYHGSNAGNIEEFRKPKIKRGLSDGVYISSSIRDADSYRLKLNPFSKRYELIARTDNPLSIDLKNKWWTEISHDDLINAIGEEKFKQLNINPKKTYTTGEISDIASKTGYDVVDFQNIKDAGAFSGWNGDILNSFFPNINANNYSVINPKNIKSLKGNVGFFDMTNPNIYKSLIGAGLFGTGAAATSNEYQQGGFIEAELTQEKIDELRKQGYTIEEL